MMHEKEPGQQQMLGQNWRKIVAAIDNLPPMPVVASRALAMVDDPNSTADEVSELLNSDPGLASQILKIANSSLFSLQREVNTMIQAVGSIGFKAIKGVILASVMRKIKKNFGEKDRLVWENSIATAMMASLLSRRLRKNYSDEVFLDGLLHNLGQLVFLSTNETTRDYLKVFEVIRERKVDYVTAEMEVIGCPHTRVGSLLANKWNFPPEICQIILHYKDESLSAQNPHEEKTVLVNLSDHMAHAAGIGSPEGYPVSKEEMRRMALLLGFEEESVDEELQQQVEALQEKYARESSVYQ